MARRAAPLLMAGGLAGGLVALASANPLATASAPGGDRPPARASLTSATGPAASAPGQVEGFGAAPTLGGPGAATTKRVVGMAASPSDQGYWVTAADGGVFGYGDAAFHGSMGGQQLASPIVGMAATPDGGGYWLVAADGGIFAFGDAAFHGSMGGQHLTSPITGVAATPDSGGYWLVAADGGIFSFGDAAFHGSLPSIAESATNVTAIAPTSTGAGYWMVEANGAIYAFGDATYAGAPPVEPSSTVVVGLAGAHHGPGYWEVTSSPPPAPAVSAAAAGRDLGTFVVTCYDDDGTTASGATTSMSTVSVDPRVIPLGSTIDIAGVGTRVAQDTGSAIKGNRLDIWEPSAATCSNWGAQSKDVTLLSSG